LQGDTFEDTFGPPSANFKIVFFSYGIFIFYFVTYFILCFFFNVFLFIIYHLLLCIYIIGSLTLGKLGYTSE